MSQWVHVTGLIRIDSMRMVMASPTNPYFEGSERDILEDRLGTTWTYGDEYAASNKVPSGTEGSIQYDIIKADDRAGYNLVWGTVVLYGDLRDFENPFLIAEWLYKALANLEDHMMTVRDISVVVDVEFRNKYHITTMPNKDGEEELVIYNITQHAKGNTDELFWLSEF